MTQLTIADILAQGDRLGLRHSAGPTDGQAVARVEVASLDLVNTVRAGTLVIVPGGEHPAPYRLDVALRQASARGLAGIVLTTEAELGPDAAPALPQTARTLAERGGIAVLAAPGAKAADLVVAIDRLLAGGAAEAIMRATHAIEKATEVAAGVDATPENILAAANRALGVDLAIVPDATVSWSAADAVCVGEVPIGRLAAAENNAAVSIALPVIASLLSRAAQRQLRDRFAPTQSRADLIVELVLADSSRVEGFVGRAARLGLPLQLSHVAAWLIPTHRSNPESRAPRSVQPAVELFTLQLVDGRDELWHLAFVQDDLLLVSTEEHGAGDHQRRLREIAVRVQEQARSLAGADWDYTVGLGTPQLGAMGLRSSAAESRIAAESAIAAGRSGSVELTDVTGLRRVLLEVYASPISRSLLNDILQPLDALGSDRGLTSVRTLLAYLAHRNSLAHAGRELNLHPNAVGYRLKRVREALQLDLDDPDIRFALELACRVRLLGLSRR